MNLDTPLKALGNVFKMYSTRLAKLDIATIYDLLYHIPTRYEDFSLILPIAKLQSGENVTIQGNVLEIKNVYTRNRKIIQQAIVEDTTGIAEIIWFNQSYITKVIHKNDPIAISGRVEESSKGFAFTSPEYEILKPEFFPNNKVFPLHTGRLVPIYSETKGVSSKWLRRQIYKLLLDAKNFLLEYLPEEVLKEHQFFSIADALEKIHFPKTLEESNKAKERLAFDEMLFIQLSFMKRKSDWQKNLEGNKFLLDKFHKEINDFWEKLPFTLTNAQRKAIHEIFQDLTYKKPMNRLLQGDVGSGKTVVAAAAMYLAFLNGFQSVFMAPTEILAQQHYKTISSLLTPLGVNVELRTGSKKGIRNKELGIKKNKDKTQRYDILIGTHAVLSENVKFGNLGLAVIDEQQRFGVEQRSIIKEKGNNPHLLTMTATPIPRTIALTFYGDLDLSVLDEMPMGRKKIKTWLVPNEKRENGYRWIEKQIKENGDQAFIVCPFIETSESMSTVKAAITEFEGLQKNVFPNLRLGLLHGKIKQKDKSEVLQKFGEKQIDILVATPVVEVGIDFPNSTIIVIEAAERFGLAQLHQLRGRVGRGDKQSYCLLFTDSKNPQTRQRLSAMETMHVGSQLAQLDLELRGPGEIYGTAQHGRRILKIASFSDFVLIAKTRKEAEKIFANLQQYPLIREKLQEKVSTHVSAN